MAWTAKQEEAITKRNSNLLVSGAAGSGKTAVLVERIKQLILQENVSVEDFLVVTFTNAAAGEMREKIVKAITKEMDKAEDSSRSAFLHKQIDSVYKANISTFHAFALEIIRTFFHVIDIEPNFKICDEAQKTVLQQQSMDKLFEINFERDDNQWFIEFLKAYAGSKNENNVREMVLTTYETIQSIPNPMEWLENATEIYNLTKDEFYKSEVYRKMIEIFRKSMLNCKKNYDAMLNLLRDNGIDKLAEKLNADANAMDGIINAIDTSEWDSLLKNVEDFKFTRMVPTKEEKPELDIIKKQVEVFRERSKSELSNIKNELGVFSVEILNDTYGSALSLMKLVKEFEQLYKAEKEKKKVIDFGDIEHYALKILEKEEVCREYREKFKYIFIDEYQDSNVIQEILVGRIKRENNLFTVGDVKQSIYKFRLAEPELFMSKYKEYRKEGNRLSAVIDLNHNFRSKTGVINAINHIFERLMPDYDDEAALHSGVEEAEEKSSENGSWGIDHEKSKDIKIFKCPEKYVYDSELHIVDNIIDEDTDEEIRELLSAEREGYIIGDIIKKSLGTEIFETDTGKIRPLEKRDIVILLRSQRNYGDKIQQALLNLGIESHMGDSDGYFDTLEIGILLNLLRIVDNKRQDVPLLSVLSSVIFSFTVNELAEIRSNCKGVPYFDAFSNFAQEKEGTLGDKARTALQQIEEWKKLSLYMPLDKFIWKIITDTGYFSYVGALAGGMQRQANVRAFIDKAVIFQESRLKGLYGFINYIEALENRKVPMGQASLINENDDVVRIMTIHKSKGLEFPMVIVAGMGKRFNTASGRKQIFVHKDVGIGLRYVNREKKYYKKTILQNIVKLVQRREEMEEEVRILYVALTRAKDKLVMIGTVKDFQTYQEKMANVRATPDNLADIMNCSNYIDMVMPTLENSKIKKVIHSIDEIGALDLKQEEEHTAVKKELEEAYKGISVLRDDEKEAVKKNLEAIDKELSYIYPYKFGELLKSKFAVTSINGLGKITDNNRLSEEQIEKLTGSGKVTREPEIPLFAEGEKTEFTAQEKGRIIHEFLERWNFHQEVAEDINIGKNQIIDFINYMAEKNYYSENEGKEAKKASEQLHKLLISSLGKRMAKAEKIWREQPFNLSWEINGETVMIQGIIDCFFKESDGYVLVDYKSNYIQNPDDEKELKEIADQYYTQLSLYKKAVEEGKNCSVKEVYLYLLSIGKEISVDV